MKQHSGINYDQRGMTLVELIIAMMILGFAVSAFLPLQAVVAKSIKTIQQKQQATQLANKIMEDLVFSTTAANYNTSADLAIGRDVDIIDGFTVEKVVSWVDDPADGTFNDSLSPNPDPVPFDYKHVTITVKAPNPFSGKLYTAFVLDSNLAREGPGDPYNGVIIKVNRIYDSGAPVASVLVTLSRGADTYTGVTDDNGQVILAVNFPSGTSDDYDYNVELTKDGWMQNPVSSKTVTLNRWSTRTKQMEMEIPQSILLTFNNQQQGGNVKVTRVADNYTYNVETIPDHAVNYTYTTALYPSGTYKLDVDLIAWQEDFDSNDGGFSRYKILETGTPNRDNPWKWTTGSWSAVPADLVECVAHDVSNNRLGKTIDLSGMEKGDPDWDVALKLNSDYFLDPGSESVLKFISISNKSGVSISSSDSDWTGVNLTSGDFTGAEIDLADDDFMEDAVSPNCFNIRFDVSKDVTRFTIDRLAMICRYRGSETFSAAQPISVRVTD